MSPKHKAMFGPLKEGLYGQHYCCCAVAEDFLYPMGILCSILISIGGITFGASLMYPISTVLHCNQCTIIIMIGFLKGRYYLRFSPFSAFLYFFLLSLYICYSLYPPQLNLLLTGLGRYSLN